MLFELSGVPVSGWDSSAHDIMALAQSADRHEFDRFGISDLRYRNDCLVTMTACAMATQHIFVSSHVTNPFVRHPSLTACAIATLADISGGRVILGLGGGVGGPSYWREDRSKPLTALREATTIIRRIWKGETVDFEGEVINCKGVKLSFPLKYRIPIMIASSSPRGLALAGEMADSVLLGSRFNGSKHYADNVAQVKRGMSKREKHLKDIEINISVQSCVSDDTEKAMHSSKPFAATGIMWAAALDKYSKESYAHWEPPAGFSVPEKTLQAVARWDFSLGRLGLPENISSLLTKDVIDQFAISGTPEQVAARYQEIMQYPDLDGIRIHMIPVEGKPMYEGFLETLNGLGKVLEIIKGS